MLRAEGTENAYLVKENYRKAWDMGTRKPQLSLNGSSIAAGKREQVQCMWPQGEEPGAMSGRYRKVTLENVKNIE